MAYIEFDTNKIIEKYIEMKESCPDIKFIFPVKCCTNEYLLSAINQYVDGYDVSNEKEYKCILQYVENKIISATGPLVEQLLIYPNILVAANTTDSWIPGIGVRVNFNSNDAFLKTHFGVDLCRVPSKIFESSSYVHFHISDSRSENIKMGIISNVVSIVELFPKLEVLNIGGHLTNMPKNEVVDYLNSIRWVLPDNIVLLVEAGDFFVENSGCLYCEVIDSFLYSDTQTVYLDVSKESQLRWSYPSLAQNHREKTDKLYNTVFYGASCHEKDLIAKSMCSKLRKGDSLVFENITTYSYEWNRAFNGLDEIEIKFL